MPSLDESFRHFVDLLSNQSKMNAGGGDPFFFLAHDPSELFSIRELLPSWEGHLINCGFAPVVVSFSDLLWNLIDASGRWDEWCQIEADGYAEPSDINDAVTSVLNAENAILNAVESVIANAPPNGVVLFTDAHTFHPFFRTYGLENALQGRGKRPTLVLYPGTRSGQFGLRFLGLYDLDGKYRATILGGMS